MPSFPVPGISKSKRFNKVGVVLQQQQQPHRQANGKQEGQQALQIFKTRTASRISFSAVVHVLQPTASRQVSDKRYSGHAQPVTPFVALVSHVARTSCRSEMLQQQQQQVGRPGSMAGNQGFHSGASAGEGQLAEQLQQMKAELAAAQQRLHDSGKLQQLMNNNYQNEC